VFHVVPEIAHLATPFFTSGYIMALREFPAGRTTAMATSPEPRPYHKAVDRQR
jgi:hypothetical protein